MAERADHNHQIVDQFSRQAEGYARLTGDMTHAERQKAFRDLIGVRPDDLVLDACCGPGVLALDLAPHVSHVTGLDLTPAMLERARAAQTQKGLGNVDWINGDVCALPFGDGAFSLVVSSAAFHHLRQPRAAFGEMLRVCRPGGRIVVRDVTPAHDKSAAYDRMERLRDPSHVHALTPGEMGDLGCGLPVNAPTHFLSLTADLPLKPILAASFPQACTRKDLHALFLADARSGEDSLGFSAKLIDGEILVSYPMTTAIWIAGVAARTSTPDRRSQAQS
jgi:ubiquinone/menaquinone biosynthesis C-methylase UbiE